MMAVHEDDLYIFYNQKEEPRFYKYNLKLETLTDSFPQKGEGIESKLIQGNFFNNFNIKNSWA